MRFNSEKFECLRFWANPEALPPVQYLGPDNTNIEVKSDLRNLGVRISSNLNFNIHVENICLAESRLVG